jgi:sigma-54 dependent transcriptional regulator, acetoin dehydrogenase operon transcriptional activator AcoR
MGAWTSGNRHAASVMNLVEHFPRVPDHVERPVAFSWLRCCSEFQLRPDHPRAAEVLEQAALRQVQERIDDVVSVARAEMDALYEQIPGSGYALLLTDAAGVILHEKTDPTLSRDFRKAGLIKGADWSERAVGTNGIGTCITERRPITIHLEEHFFSSNIGLTCSAAPIRDPRGELIAVLDASNVSCEERKASRSHTGALVNMSARLIEKCVFLRRHRDQRTIRFHSRPEFVNLLHDGAIAFTEDGRILAADDTAVALLALDCRDDLVGRNISDVFDITDAEYNGTSRRAGSPIMPVRDRSQGRRYYASMLAAAVSHSVPRVPPHNAEVVQIEQCDDAPHHLTLEEIAGDDPSMLRNLRGARRIANSNVSALIQGPTGSGKEVFARALHEASDRKNRPFIAVNCASIPESLIESELFGYRQGAFTGARKEGMPGRVQQADGGTLFLDEIGDMPLALQTRLLRVLEEREVTPLGGLSPIKVNVRVISASHRNLRNMIQRGEFREDLYYRLNGITLNLPALRERADLDKMIRSVLAEENRDGGPVGIEMAAFDRLMHYPWPGNVRELRNVVRTALAIAEGGVIRLTDLPPDVQDTTASSSGTEAPNSASTGDVAIMNIPSNGETSPENPLDIAERRALLETVRRARWNMTLAARQLDISRNTLYRKLKHHGISPESLRDQNTLQH